jgi:multisubunit Na+/H+ antiporter MnhC subunit
MKLHRFISSVTGIILLFCGGLLIVYGAYLLSRRDVFGVNWKTTLLQFSLGLLFVVNGAMLLRHRSKKKTTDVLDDFLED